MTLRYDRRSLTSATNSIERELKSIRSQIRKLARTTNDDSVKLKCWLALLDRYEKRKTQPKQDSSDIADSLRRLSEAPSPRPELEENDAEEYGRRYN